METAKLVRSRGIVWRTGLYFEALGYVQPAVFYGLPSSSPLNWLPLPCLVCAFDAHPKWWVVFAMHGPMNAIFVGVLGLAVGAILRVLLAEEPNPH